jgi:hypothetical protein
VAFLFALFFRCVYIICFVANTNLARMSKGVNMEKTKTTKNNANQKVEKATNTKNKANTADTKNCGKGCECKDR